MPRTSLPLREALHSVLHNIATPATSRMRRDADHERENFTAEPLLPVNPAIIVKTETQSQIPSSSMFQTANPEPKGPTNDSCKKKIA